MSKEAINQIDILIDKYNKNIIRMKHAKDNLKKEISDYEYIVQELKIGKQRLEDIMVEKYGRML